MTRPAVAALDDVLVRSDKPVARYIRAAMREGVSMDTAWSMWRVMFPKATRRIFRDQWAEEVRGNV